jgi:hypothetical protein
MRQQFDAWRAERLRIGDPPGTLHVWRTHISQERVQRASRGDPPAKASRVPFPALLFMVEVDTWDLTWPQAVLGSEPPLTVILAAHIPVDPPNFLLLVDPTLADPTTNAWVNLRWWWQRPERPAAVELLNASRLDKAKFGRLAEEAQQAFERFREKLGRPRDKSKFWPSGTESDFLTKVNEKIAIREHDDVTITTVEMLAGDMGMSRSALYEMFKRVPEARDRYWEHKRRSPRY